MLNAIKKKWRRVKYKQYLKSPRWKKKRFLVLKRDHFKCTVCGRKRNLNVHHKTYKNIFNEPLCDLVTVCKVCHKKIHRR